MEWWFGNIRITNEDGYYYLLLAKEASNSSGGILCHRLHHKEWCRFVKSHPLNHKWHKKSERWKKLALPSLKTRLNKKARDIKCNCLHLHWKFLLQNQTKILQASLQIKQGPYSEKLPGFWACIVEFLLWLVQAPSLVLFFPNCVVMYHQHDA